jgi:type II restriction/modification system DNA methylase subunit YeeA
MQPTLGGMPAMNLNKLEKFANQTRKKLLDIVASKLEYVLETDSAELREKSRQVQELKKELAGKDKESLIEEVAYTWFNRFTALRFMDARGYTETKTVSPLPGHIQPEILEVFKGGYCPRDLPVDKNRLFRLLDGSIPARDPQNEVYRFLLLGVCNVWHDKMPFMFQKLQDYTELLMPDDLLSEHSILAEMNENISDDDCKDVEIIGWMYQFYVSEKHDAVIKAKKKIAPEDIPAATELFTPHWIVRYILENTLGRLWMLNRPESRLKEVMEYYIEPEEKELDFLKVPNPEEITICDPACGSGHMLTYAFDLLVRIYEEQGYDRSDIARLILEKNLYGIEIDQRAAALAAFALTMKARAYDGKFFRNGLIQPNIVCLKKVTFEEEELKSYKEALGEDLYTPELEETLLSFENIDSIGSLLKPALLSPEYYLEKLGKKDFQNNWILKATHDKVRSVLRQTCYLSRKYHCVVANPPYMGNKHMNDVLKEFAREYFSNTKSDLFSMFIERNLDFAFEGGQAGFMTPFVWMFISSYEKLRNYLIEEKTITSLIQLEYSGFEGATVPVCTFTVENRRKPDYKGAFIRLSDFRGAKKQAPKTLEAIENPDCGWFYRVYSSDFKKIPGSPIAYWVSESFRLLYENVLLGSFLDVKEGVGTRNDDLFMRRIWEVSKSQVSSKKRWILTDKAGDYRRWYMGFTYVMDWEDNGCRIKSYRNSDGSLRSRPQNTQYLFKEGVTWGKVGSGIPSFRWRPKGLGFNDAAPTLFGDKVYEILAQLNSSVIQAILAIKGSTLNITTGVVSEIPLLPLDPDDKAKNYQIIENAIFLSSSDWNSYETSWDFSTLPLIEPELRQSTLEATYKKVRAHWQDMTLEMKRLEEENNRIFIEAYGLQDELTPDVPLEEITLTCNPRYRYGNKKTEEELEALLLADTMREFISYAVGCMFGRYSLNKPGLVLANQAETVKDYIEKVGLPKEEITFLPDEDNVLPLTEGEYFTDDIVTKFKRFLRVTFGEEYYEQNLVFIEKALGKDIRKYFLSEFYPHHVRMYKKRPIYWLFSSPRRTFNALVYLHRYNPDTVNTVLNDYLRQFIKKLEAEKSTLETRKALESLSARDSAQIEKDLEGIKKQLRELAEYERNILFPLAAKRLEIDLDDGVKVNYAKFGDALYPVKM